MRSPLSNEIRSRRKRRSAVGYLGIGLIAIFVSASGGCAKVSYWGFVDPFSPRVSSEFGPATGGGQDWVENPCCYGYHTTQWRLWPCGCIEDPPVYTPDANYESIHLEEVPIGAPESGAVRQPPFVSDPASAMSLDPPITQP